MACGVLYWLLSWLSSEMVRKLEEKFRHMKHNTTSKLTVKVPVAPGALLPLVAASLRQSCAWRTPKSQPNVFLAKANDVTNQAVDAAGLPLEHSLQMSPTYSCVKQLSVSAAGEFKLSVCSTWVSIAIPILCSVAGNSK